MMFLCDTSWLLSRAGLPASDRGVPGGADAALSLPGWAPDVSTPSCTSPPEIVTGPSIFSRRSAQALLQQRQLLLRQLFALRHVLRVILAVQADGAVELALLQPATH